MAAMSELDYQAVMQQTPRLVAQKLGIDNEGLSSDEILAAIEASDSVAYRTLSNYLNVYREWWNKTKEQESAPGDNRLRNTVIGLADQRDTWRRSLVLYFGSSSSSSSSEDDIDEDREVILSPKAKASIELENDIFGTVCMRGIQELRMLCPGPDDKQILMSSSSSLWAKTIRDGTVSAAIIYRDDPHEIYIVDVISNNRNVGED